MTCADRPTWGDPDPPSRATLAHRLESRAQDSKSVIDKRLANARSEIASHAEYDYLVVNDAFADALDDLEAIVRAERLRENRQREGLGALLGELLSGS